MVYSPLEIVVAFTGNEAGDIRAYTDSHGPAFQFMVSSTVQGIGKQFCTYGGGNSEQHDIPA